MAGEFPRPCRFKYCLGYRWHHPLGHGENAISGHFDHTEAQKHSLTLIVSVSFALHVSLLLIQQGLFLTSYLYALVGKDFLDIIPKPCPCSVKLSAVYVRQNCQMNSNFLLAARKLKQSILGSSAVILWLEIYHENSSACPPSNLKLHAVSPQRTTPISLRFLLCITWAPFTPDLGSLHTAMDSVSGWPLPRSLNYKLCKCSVVRNTPQCRT